MQSANSSSSGNKLPPFLRRAIAIRATERTPLQKLLLHSLNSRSDKSGVSWPSIDQLELDTGLARSTVIKIMGQLRSAGLVLTTRSGSHSHRNVYLLNLFREDSTARAGVPINPGLNSQGEDINKPANKSGSRTRTSPSQVSTSPADGLDPSVSQTCPSFKSSLKRVIEEEAHANPRGKRIRVLRRWLHVIENIDLPLSSISTWFCTFKPVSLVKGVLLIESDIEFAVDWCNRQYPNELSAMNVEIRLIQLTEEVVNANNN